MSDTQTIQALREALEDEYRARATYRKVLEAFGPVQPFVNIVAAEERHASALLAQFDRLGIEPPLDSWPARVKGPRSLAEACEAAVQAEIENEAMYERLIPKINDPILRRVMRRLRDASQHRHLPAFRNCLAREGAGGMGGGSTVKSGHRRRIRGGRPAA